MSDFVYKLQFTYVWIYKEKWHILKPIILEEVTPKNDDFLRLKREELWIRNYQSIEFAANKHFLTFLYTFW